jgi:hypothetical protein
MEKFPLASVCVAVFVPFTATVTPGIPLPDFESVTVPLMVDWAQAPKDTNIKNNKTPACFDILEMLFLISKI